MNPVQKYIYQVFIAIDQLGNAFLGGMADETISARCYRQNHRAFYALAEKIINAIFYPVQGPDHCYQAYLKEFTSLQKPTEQTKCR